MGKNKKENCACIIQVPGIPGPQGPPGPPGPPTPLPTIYTGDGILESERTVNQVGLGLHFQNGSTFEVGPVQPINVGNNRAGILVDQNNFFGTANPGAGFVRFTASPLEVYTLSISEDFFPNGGIVSSLGYDIIGGPDAGFGNLARATNEFAQIISGVPATQTGEIITVNANAPNSYDGTGLTTIQSNEVRLVNVPVTNSTNTDFLTRNTTNGSIEITPVFTILTPFLATGSVYRIGTTLNVADGTPIVFTTLGQPAFGFVQLAGGLVVPVSGQYEFTWSVYASREVDGLIQLGLRINGVVYPATRGATEAIADTPTWVQGHAIVLAGAGDLVELVNFSGVSIDIYDLSAQNVPTATLVGRGAGQATLP
jgi:hypothetical protein